MWAGDPAEARREIEAAELRFADHSNWLPDWMGKVSDEQ
jgi:hypothetical protein